MTGGARLITLAALVAAVQIGFLGWMILGRAAILRDGSEIVLEVRPVDPRDLLRGDYVVLAYNISTLAAPLFGPLPDDGAPYRDHDVFVRLGPGADGIWHAKSANLDRPAAEPAGPDEVDIRGRAFIGRGGDAGRLIRVDYGIERFYLPEGEGREIERNLAVRSFTMRVAVADDGTAQIKSFHDGEVMLFAEPLY